MSDCEVQAMEDFMSQPLPSTDFDDWWDLKGRYMKNEPGENINDTELPHRVAIAAWKAAKERGSNS